MNVNAITQKIVDGSVWSPRFPLLREERLSRLGSPRHDPVPKQPGIYRIHVEGVPLLAYVGQSGDLRRRMNDLSGIYKSVMPYTDPHIGGPCLWAWRQIPPSRPYTVSFAPFESTAYFRQGLEDLVLAYYRWETARLSRLWETQTGWPASYEEDILTQRALSGEDVQIHGYKVRSSSPQENSSSDELWRTAYSPLANYHRMPYTWISSTTRKMGIRGGKAPALNADVFPAEEEESGWFDTLRNRWAPSIAPRGEFFDPRDPVADLQWGGFEWSAWRDPRGVLGDERMQGLYRIRTLDGETMLFIGRGNIKSAARGARRFGEDLLFSWTSGSWSSREQLELLTDLLGLYLRKTGKIPLAQYGGEGNDQAGSALYSLTPFMSFLFTCLRFAA